jgi:hypothetical protein
VRAARKGPVTVFISTYESRNYVAMILKVQKLIATYIVERSSHGYVKKPAAYARAFLDNFQFSPAAPLPPDLP